MRIRDRGHINWVLVGLDIPGGEDPRPGDPPWRQRPNRRPAGLPAPPACPTCRGVALAMAHTSIPLGATIRVHGDGDRTIEARVRAEVC